MGASAAFFAVGGILLASKLFDFSEAFCLIGVLALLVFIPCYIIFGETDRKRLAKRLDNDLELQERVSTMVEYEGSDEDIVQLQRQDAQKRLAEYSTKVLKFRHLWLYLLILVLAVALLVGAVVYPKADIKDPDDTDDDEPPREITDWEWKALDELIEYVRTSNADAAVMKRKTLSALEALRKLLVNEVSDSELNTLVRVTVTEINNAAAESEKEEYNLSDEQKQINLDVAKYTVEKLFEIFKLGSTEDDVTDSNSGNDDEKDDNSPPASGDNTMGADLRIFDPEKGYVKYGDVIDEYYRAVDDAFAEGTISKEEWYELMFAYFTYLYGSDTETSG